MPTARPCVLIAGDVVVGRREFSALGVSSAYSIAEVVGSVEAALADPVGTLTQTRHVLPEPGPTDPRRSATKAASGRPTVFMNSGVSKLPGPVSPLVQRGNLNRECRRHHKRFD